MYIGEEGGYTSRPIEPGASQDDGLLEAVRGLVARFIRTSRGAGGRGATRAPPPNVAMCPNCGNTVGLTKRFPRVVARVCFYY